MTHTIHVRIVAAAALLVGIALGAACAGDATPPSMDKSPVVLSAPEAQVVTEFDTRVQDYLALHRKLEATLPGLPKQATPEQIDANQRSLSALIRTARVGAKQGAFFTPGMQTLVRRALGDALAGPGGKISKAAIMDDNPGLPNLAVNDRYPDTIPLSTMPLEVLKALPKLDAGLEYRFIGERLALMDAHACIVIDFTDNVLP